MKILHIVGARVFCSANVEDEDGIRQFVKMISDMSGHSIGESSIKQLVAIEYYEIIPGRSSIQILRE